MQGDDGEDEGEVLIDTQGPEPKHERAQPKTGAARPWLTRREERMMDTRTEELIAIGASVTANCVP